MFFWLRRFRRYVPREYYKTCPEVHVAGICLRYAGNNIYVLIAKRNTSREIYPDLYEGCGGQLARDETFSECIRRHYRYEMGLRVAVDEGSIKVYSIKKPDTTIPGVRFTCRYLYGEAHSTNHSEIRWVSKEQLLGIPEEFFIPGLRTDFLSVME